MDTRIEGLRAFLDGAHSAYHAQAQVVEKLLAAGYTRLRETEEWHLSAGGKYFMTRGGTSVLAFRVPQGTPQGFLMAASHCDRPGFKLKENLELTGPYTRAGVEGYGGMLMAPWLDRPLTLAGRVTVETEKGVENRLVYIDRDLLLIPSVAIHMNRQANDGYKWNPAVDMQPLLGGKDAAGRLETLLEEEAGGRILGRDLYLCLRQKSSVWGIGEEYLSAAGLDDLECVWATTEGFLKAEDSRSIPVLCVFDSEEVGSCSPQGAASMLLQGTLERICKCLSLEPGRLLGQSFMVSADNGHALHPNHPELSDSANAPIPGGGVLIKYNANLSYSTDGLSAAVFRRICAGAGVPVQNFYNRADTRGGSTLGHISLAHVSVPTVDIGLAQLAMHSCFETASVKDAAYLADAMTAYYGTTLTAREDGLELE